MSRIRGVYLWGNHSPTMLPDISRAEVELRSRWVSVEEAFDRSREEGPAISTESETEDEAREEGTEWSRWISSTLVPAVRKR